MPQFLDVDPRELRLPSPRRSGADPYKLQRQIARLGASAAGMPPPVVFEAADGVLVLYNGVTRAMRIAKLAPGTLIRVELWGKTGRKCRNDPKIGDPPAMITPTQQEILRGLANLLDLDRDVRFGQLVAFLGFLSEDMNGRGIWDVEDDELLPVIERFRKDLEARFSGIAESA